MSKLMTTEVFTFDELSDAAKETARNWFRDVMNETGFDDLSFLYDDFDIIAKIFGISIDHRSQKNINTVTGKEWTTDNLQIMWAGFSSQGDGACFEGSYAYAKGAPKAIRAHAPDDKELHRIADALQDIQRRNFYKIEGTVKHRGHYYHANSTEISLDGCTTKDAEATVAELLRDYMNWIYRTLEKEYEYRNADEQVDESILANEYEFTTDGKRTVVI